MSAVGVTAWFDRVHQDANDADAANLIFERYLAAFVQETRFMNPAGFMASRMKLWAGLPPRTADFDAISCDQGEDGQEWSGGRPYPFLAP